MARDRYASSTVSGWQAAMRQVASLGGRRTWFTGLGAATLYGYLLRGLESIAQRDQSSSPRAPSSSRTRRWSLAHTLAFVHSAKRR
ncbi:hypothetical protein [Streptomyces canus]|uniref:hypothetical protein n=1 Tax=Streptomyces canus TaxID=58343 RepID=UPI0038704F70